MTPYQRRLERVRAAMREMRSPIRAGMCFTIEPKVWKPGAFYVRCEDVIGVGKDRGTPLTQFHYEPNMTS